MWSSLALRVGVGPCAIWARRAICERALRPPSRTTPPFLGGFLGVALRFCAMVLRFSARSFGFAQLAEILWYFLTVGG